MALHLALLTSLVLVVGASMVTTRALSSWRSSNAESQATAAKNAAEYGLNEVIGQLNAPANSYLLVSLYSQWGSITASELNQCGVSVPSTSSTLKTLTPASVITIANSNNRLAYQLSNYTPPLLPPGNSQIDRKCSGTTALKLGNLSGGSATVQVVGIARNSDGSEAARHTLTRRVHVVAPNDALANPILLTGTGSQLLNLKGNMCRGSGTNDSCSGAGATLVSCIKLEDCLLNNISSDPSMWDDYCRINTGKALKVNAICNNFQQAPSTSQLPPYPSISSTTIYGSAINLLSGSSVQNAKVICAKDGSCAVSWMDSKGKTNTASNIQYFPYNTSSPPTSILDPIVGICQRTADLAISCVVDELTTEGRELIVYTQLDASTTPVNLFLRGSADPISKLINYNRISLADGVTNNAVLRSRGASTQSWKNLRILSANSSTNSCGSTRQYLKIDSKKGIGVDGGFLWLPEARVDYQSAGQTNAEFVAWICELDWGGTSAKPKFFTPVNGQNIVHGLREILYDPNNTLAKLFYRTYGANQALAN